MEKLRGDFPADFALLRPLNGFDRLTAGGFDPLDKPGAGKRTASKRRAMEGRQMNADRSCQQLQRGEQGALSLVAPSPPKPGKP
jgi:hypothetical protein